MNNLDKDKLKNQKKTRQKNETARFKEQYFQYYDDVKSHTHKIVDW